VVELEFGPYIIALMENGNYWIENADSEGMEVTAEAMIGLIDAYWKENF
jgi:hypothetical protein